MDIRSIESSEDFNKLSLEEKKEYIHELIHSGAAGSNVSAAFFNPATGKAVGMSELVEAIGEEKVTEMLMKALSEPATETATLTGESFKELKAKEAAGTLSQSEEAMLRFIESQFAHDKGVQFENTFITLLCDLIKFGREEENYDAKLTDLIIGVQAFTYITLKHADGNPFGQFTNADVSTIHTLEEQIGEDIYNTWKSSCTSEPNPGLVIMGLLHIASKIAQSMNVSFPSSDTLDAIFNGITNMGNDGEAAVTENADGSNEPVKVCKPATYDATNEDKEMRDLLKD